MSDMTDVTEHMLVAPDADGGDQLVDDGGVVTLLIQNPQRRRLCSTRTRLCRMTRTPRTQ